MSNHEDLDDIVEELAYGTRLATAATILQAYITAGRAPTRGLLLDCVITADQLIDIVMTPLACEECNQQLDIEGRCPSCDHPA